MKELCKLNKEDVKEVIPHLVEQLHACRFVCKKCARIAPEKDWLCKPLSIRKLLGHESSSNEEDSSS